jgi:hypothetical protein
MALCASVAIALTLIASGAASRYDPGVFERTVRVRQGYSSLPRSGYSGYIALLDCSRVGEIVWVCFEDDSCTRLLVADCAGIKDGGAAWMRRGGYAGEVDYETAMRTKCVGQQIRVFTITERRYQFT